MTILKIDKFDNSMGQLAEVTMKACARLASTFAFLLLLSGCASPPNSSQISALSKIHASNVPNGSLRAGQVVEIASDADVAAGTWARNALTRAGISDADIGVGSVVIARVFCCGGSIEHVTAPAAYVPKGLAVQLGDYVEIWSDTSVQAGTVSDAKPNTVTRVLQTAHSPSHVCRWHPENPDLWLRVVYCDWMPQQGWSEQAGSYPFWIKVVGPLPS